MNYTPPKLACAVSPYEVNTIFWEAGHEYAGLNSHLFTEAQLRSEVERVRRETVEECARIAEGHYGDGFRLAEEFRSLK